MLSPYQLSEEGGAIRTPLNVSIFAMLIQLSQRGFSTPDRQPAQV